MKRGGPLKRKTPLRSKTPLKARTTPRPSALSPKTMRRRIRGPKTRLMNRADHYFSLRIRERDVVCQMRVAKNCRGEAEQCCHIIGRDAHRIRWDDRNAIGGCHPCHSYYTIHPAAFTLFVIERMGLRAYHKLLLDAVPRGPVDPAPVLEKLKQGRPGQGRLTSAFGRPIVRRGSGAIEG